jgi:hypothetical protein
LYRHLVFDGDEEEHYPLDELLAHQRDEAHVEEDAREHRQRDQLQQRRQEDGGTDQQVGDHRRQTLLPFFKKIWIGLSFFKSENLKEIAINRCF